MNSRILLLAMICVLSHTTAPAATIYQDVMYGVQKTSNLVYGTGLVNNGASSIDLKLDIYQPTDIGTPVLASRPTVMFMHGGGWVNGNKSGVNQANTWASRGYNVVSIDYRLLGDNPPLTTGPADAFTFLEFLGPPGIISEVNASLEDASLALAWMSDNASTYGIDTSRVALAGSSAGGVMSLALAYLEAKPNRSSLVR